MHFFSEMSGAIETSEAPIRIDEAHDEGDATLLPSSIIDEGREHEFSMLMRWCDCWYCNEDDEEGYEGGPKSDFGDCR